MVLVLTQLQMVMLINLTSDNNMMTQGVKIPGVYARVSIVVDWIKELTSDGLFCKKPSDGPATAGLKE